MMIEIIDMKDRPLDITPQLLIAAYNVIRQYKYPEKCGDCPLHNKPCSCYRTCPRDWPEAEVPDAQE